MTTSNAEYLPVIGKTITAIEKTALLCSIPFLSSQYAAPAQFWGKVCGYKKDYLVAQVAPNGFFGPRISFYSINGGVTWQMLEEPTEDQAEFCELLRGVYQGDPTFEYKMRKDIPPDPEPVVEIPTPDELLAKAREEAEKHADDADDEEDEEEEGEEGSEEGSEEEGEEDMAAQVPKKKKPKFMIVSVPESIRLAHFIALHDSACCLVVRGQYLLQGGQCGSENRCFSGQPLHHALKPSCYLKARHMGCTQRNSVLYGPTYNVHSDYLMPITDDAPEGVWVVKYDPTLNVVTVQNLFFEGSLFWYRPGTVECGQVYYGNGERNFELCFVL